MKKNLLLFIIIFLAVNLVINFFFKEQPATTQTAGSVSIKTTKDAFAVNEIITVEIKNNEVRIYNSEFPESFTLQEDYLALHQETVGNLFVKLDGDDYYVLGDNRFQSSDSRRWGALDKSFITGRAFIRLWPVSKIKKFQGISY